MLTSQNTAIVLDSTADVPDARDRHANWRVVPLYIRFGDEVFRDHVELTPAEFYARLRTAREQPRSSQPSPADFEEAFRTLLDEYERVVCVVVSSKLSGTWESARLAADAIGDERVIVVDSGTASAGIVLLAEAIERRLARGTTAEDVDRLGERYRAEARFLFTLQTLEYLVRGGRIGRAAGLAGQLLDTKPVLAVEAGEVAPVKRVRGRRRALAEVRRLFAEATEDHEGLDVGIVHADAAGEAEQLAAAVRELRPRARLLPLAEFGPVLGTNTGPGAVAIAWFADAVAGDG